MVFRLAGKFSDLMPVLPNPPSSIETRPRLKLTVVSSGLPPKALLGTVVRVEGRVKLVIPACQKTPIPMVRLAVRALNAILIKLGELNA